jgi:hypothetical protein
MTVLRKGFTIVYEFASRPKHSIEHTYIRFRNFETLFQSKVVSPISVEIGFYRTIQYKAFSLIDLINPVLEVIKVEETTA